MLLHVYMKNNSQLTATTVKIDKSLYGDFKILGIRSGMTLQDFVEKCVYLYVKDTPFQTIINSFTIPLLSNTASFIIIDANYTASFTGSI